MYHQQALDSSAQTTTLNAQMPRPFVRGYDRQAVSRAQGGGVYIKGHSRMNGMGFSVGMVGSDEPTSDMGGVDAMPFLARMARQRGYSQAQIDGYRQSRGRGFGEIDWDEEERKREREAQRREERRAKLTPEQRAREDKQGRQRDRAAARYSNMTMGEKVSETLSKPFTKKRRGLMSLF